MGKVLNIYKNELMPRIDYLNNQFKKAYFDRTFLFSNSEILKEWTTLVGLIETINDVKDEINEMDKEEDSRLFLLNLLALYKLDMQYMHLHGSYLAATDELTKPVVNHEAHELESLSANDNQNIARLCDRVRQSCCDMQSALADIRDFLQPVMSHGWEIIQKLCPSREDIVNAIADDIRHFTLCVTDVWLDDMKRDLDRHYKSKLSDPYTFELWGEMLSVEEEALKMAMEGRFSNCYEEKQERWSEDMKRLMDKNSELIRRIWWLCYRDKFIDLTYPCDEGDVIPLLDAQNLDMVYEIIVRRSIIQCEMSPELKKQYDIWLYGTNQLNDPAEEAINSQKGKSRFTSAQVGIFIKAVAALTEKDKQPTCEMIGKLVEKIAGYAATTAGQNLKGKRNSKDIEVVANALEGIMPNLAKVVK